MKKKILLLLIFLCFNNLAKAQIILTGIVKDSSYIKGDRLIASISLIDGNTLLNTIVTDTSGRFHTGVPSNKKIKVVVSSLGYKKYSQEIFISKDTLIIIKLSQSINELEEVVVKSVKQLIQYDLDKVIINVKDNKFLSGKSVLSILDYAPGVWIDPINKGISMKGNSVSIYINDRKTSMSGDELNTYLSSLNASNIKSIELISNPSAKYDAQGSGGIINITLNKPTEDGVDTSLENIVKQGVYFDEMVAAQINAQVKNKLTIYSSYVNSFGIDLVRWTEKSNFLESNNLQDFSQQNKTKFTRNNFRIGAGYILNKKNTLSLELFKNNGSTNGILDSDGVLTSNIQSPASSILKAERDSHSDINRLNLNCNYRRILDTMGRQILMIFDYSDLNSDDASQYSNQYFNIDEKLLSNNIRLSNQTSAYKIYSYKADIDYPINKDIKAEMGVKYGYITNSSILDFKNKLNETFVADSLLSNKFNYQESVLAAYGALQTKLGKGLLVKMGLRLEYTKGKGESVTLNQNQAREYLNIFPSFFLQKQFNQNKHTLNLSYSRRINRPSFRYYNPFVSYSTDFVSYTGNPSVLPEYTNSYEASINFNGGITFNTYYKESIQSLDEVQTKLNDNNIRYQYRNLDYYKNLGVSLNLQQKITNEWDLSFFSTTYFKHYQSFFADASSINNSAFAYFLRVTNNISLGKGYQASLTAFYSSKEVYGQRTINGLYSVNAYVSKSILKSNVNLSLSCEDILNSYRENLHIQQQSLSTVIDRTYERRTFSLSIKYNFKRGKKITKVSKKDSNEEETRRSY